MRTSRPATSESVAHEQRSASRDRFSPLGVRLAIAVGGVALAAILSVLLLDIVGRGILVAFVAAVAASAWFGGLRLGLVATVLSAAAFDYFVLDPRQSLTLTHPGDLFAMAVLSLTAALFSAISRSMRHSLTTAEVAERRVSDILESIADPLVVHDAEWRFRYVNGPALEVFARFGHRAAADLLQRTVWDVFPGLRGTEVESEMRRSARERTRVTFEAFYGPTSVWSEISCYPTSDGGLVTSWRDITERKRIEELSNRLAAIVQGSDDGIVSKTLDGVIRSWNVGAERIFGWTSAEAVGQHISLIIPEDRKGEEEDIIARIQRGERVDHFETVRRRKDGTLIDVSVTISPIRDGNGRVVSASKIARDITRQKREIEGDRFLAEASALLASSLDYEQTLSRVVELAVPHFSDWCSAYVLDEAGAIKRLGEAFTADLDTTLARALRMELADGVVTTGMMRVLRSGRTELHTPSSSHVAIAPDHEDRHDPRERASIVTVPLTARDSVLGALTLAWVRRGRRHTEQDLAVAEELGRRAGVAMDNARLFRGEQRAREEAERLRLEAEQARHEAEKANRAKTDFLATMSHELRTPLNAIAGYAELLALGVRGDLTDAQREDLRRIQRSQRHLLSLINDVLNFARIDSGHLNVRLSPVSLAETLAGVETLIAPMLAAKRLRYECAEVDPALHVTADRDKLVQVLLNLLSNAVKFTGEGGRISISWKATDSVVRLSVADTGCGIPSDKLEAVFDPFVQVDRGLTRTSEGAGLGLAISRDLTRAMGGDIVVESEIGVGSTFTVTLVRSRPERSTEPLAAASGRR